ncbi:hypothetical protein COO60DRAFT_1103021 [Scenedesmus sp. NREL 46B-D3]|nr:hypothetical protein COO60DRAFT_1103021 [Scenedesmus sp. NREL 46B-D3]
MDCWRAQVYKVLGATLRDGAKLGRGSCGGRAARSLSTAISPAHLCCCCCCRWTSWGAPAAAAAAAAFNCGDCEHNTAVPQLISLLRLHGAVCRCTGCWGPRRGRRQAGPWVMWKKGGQDSQHRHATVHTSAAPACWCAQVYKVLEATPRDGAKLGRAVREILAREVTWVMWKKGGKDFVVPGKEAAAAAAAGPAGKKQQPSNCIDWSKPPAPSLEQAVAAARAAAARQAAQKRQRYEDGLATLQQIGDARRTYDNNGEPFEAPYKMRRRAVRFFYF